MDFGRQSPSLYEQRRVLCESDTWRQGRWILASYQSCSNPIRLRMEQLASHQQVEGRIRGYLFAHVSIPIRKADGDTGPIKHFGCTKHEALFARTARKTRRSIRATLPMRVLTPSLRYVSNASENAGDR